MIKKTEENSTYTVLDYLASSVKFGIPKKALYAKMIDRDLDPEAEYSYDFKQHNNNKIRLVYADMIKWFVVGMSKKNNTSDSDNGWSHAGGGYEIDDTDRKILIAEANAIYKELEPASVIKSKSTFRMNSFGTQHCNYDAAGNPLPHIIR